MINVKVVINLNRSTFNTAEPESVFLFYSLNG